MQNVLNLLTLFFIIAVGFNSVALTSPPSHVDINSPNTISTENSVKSYKEWKLSKIAEIENRIQVLRDKLSHSAPRKLGSSQDPNLGLPKNEFEAGLAEDVNKQLEKEMLTLSMSQDLTISDYFVGYLTKQTSLEVAIKEVSGRMTPDEVADLMIAFAEHFFQSRPTTSKSKTRAGFGQ